MPPTSIAPTSSWLRSRFPAQSALLLIGCLSLLAFIAAYQLPAPQLIQVGEAGAERYLSGFYFPEGQDGQAYRWSGSSAQVSFVGVGRRPWRLALRLSALRPAGTVPVTVTVNGYPLAQVELGGAMAEQEFRIAPRQIGALANVSVGLASPTFSAPPDTRQLGLMVEWARLEPDGLAVTLPPLQVLAGLLISLAFCYYSLRRWRVPDPWAFAPVVALAGLGAAGIALDRPLLARYLPWITAILGLWWLFSQQLRRARWWEWIALAAIAWAGKEFAARALDFYQTSLPQGDFMIYFRAADNLRTGAPLYDYASARGIPLGPVYKYPPLFAILMAPTTVFPAWTVSAAAYLVNIGLLFVALFVLLKWAPGAGKTRRAWYYLTVLGFLLYRPAWEGIIRGQPDTLMLLCIVGALLLLRTRRGQVAAGVVLSFATMLKIYPGLLLLYLAWKRRWSALAGFVGAFVAMLLVSVWVVGWDTCWHYVTDILTVQSGAAPYPENQSYNGFLARLVVPGSQTTWYTSVQFPRPTLVVYYLLILITLIATIWLLNRVRAAHSSVGFEMGYAILMPLTILIWPISWVHNEILLLLPYALMFLHEMQSERPSWPMLVLIGASYLATAIGNEYTVLLPSLQEGWPRLLQSYKLYGVIVLWLAMLWKSTQGGVLSPAARAATPERRPGSEATTPAGS